VNTIGDLAAAVAEARAADDRPAMVRSMAQLAAAKGRAGAWEAALNLFDEALVMVNATHEPALALEVTARRIAMIRRVQGGLTLGGAMDDAIDLAQRAHRPLIEARLTAWRAQLLALDPGTADQARAVSRLAVDLADRVGARDAQIQTRIEGAGAGALLAGGESLLPCLAEAAHLSDIRAPVRACLHWLRKIGQPQAAHRLLLVTRQLTDPTPAAKAANDG